jgi:hypothetical protein
MEYSEQTCKSASAAKRFSQRTRFKRYANFLTRNSNPKLTAKFLDYGAGDGYIFNYLRSMGVTGFTISAYEPVGS